MKISQSELLKINGYKKESDHLRLIYGGQSFDSASESPKKVSPESLSDVHDKAERAMRKRLF